MKRLTRVLVFLLVSFIVGGPALMAQEPDNEERTYRLELVYIFETDATEFIFVIGNSGFRSVASLKRFIGTLPRESTLEWAPGCERLGGEPLLSSKKEMDDFRSFCEGKGIKFRLIPSG